MIVIKSLLLLAVQAQLVPLADTTTLLEPPLASKCALVVTRETVHEAAAWLMVKVCPATVIVPVRSVVFVLAATL